MTNQEKLKLFEKEVEYMTIENIKDFFTTAVTILPDYFFEVPASSSGQYHSSLECGFGGLVYHTKSVAKIANYLVNMDQYKGKLNDVERDCVICAALLHDCLKHSWENKTGYSVFEHPVLAAEFIKTDERLNGIVSDDIRGMIGDAISSHSGQWNTSKRSKTVLPTPQTLVQELVHLSDYIASRGDIHILFEENEIKPQLPDPKEYILTFGKHNGENLADAYAADKNYFEWCKENVKREPLLSLIKQLETQEDEI